MSGKSATGFGAGEPVDRSSRAGWPVEVIGNNAASTNGMLNRGRLTARQVAVVLRSRHGQADQDQVGDVVAPEVRQPTSMAVNPLGWRSGASGQLVARHVPTVIVKRSDESSDRGQRKDERAGARKSAFDR